MSGGSLCLAGGVLFVGRHAKTATVRSYDLDGRFLQEHVRFRDAAAGRSSVSGLAVDADRRLWIADAAAARLRCFTLFGREIAGVDGSASETSDRAGSLGVPVDVLATDQADDPALVVACAGERRHAVQRLAIERGRTRSLRSLGEVDGRFHGVVRLAERERYLWVLERRARRIQVFRDGEFHYAFRVSLGSGFAEPAALAPLDDGRAALAVGGDAGAVLLVDRSGRVLDVIAEHGEEAGRVVEPVAVVVEPAASDRRARIVVLDRAGDRVQLFNLEGRCYGAFSELP